METAGTTDGADAAYDRFLERVKRIANVSNAESVLRWDQEVMMPEEGIHARSRQLSTLSTIVHEELTDDAMGVLLDQLEAESLDEERAANVREVSREYERKTRVPIALVEELSRTTSEAVPTWERARAEDDFDRFAPTLEKVIELKREYAAHVDPDADPYAVLFADYEPYIDLETADAILTTLRDELVPLIEAVGDSDVELAVDAFSGTFDIEQQEALSRDVLDVLGYDWNRGRLDTAPHPFSTGTQFDARVTTRFDESDPLGALLSTIHEFGHAAYTLGLPDDAYGTPLGSARDLTVHESQSRLWENHVGRSLAFWERFIPAMTRRFPHLDGISAMEAYEAVNRVYDDNPIRVEADELTYHMHVVLRYEIERELIHGDLSAEDVPERWNDKMETYLGFRPDSDADGCLQDIHWSHGSFGYFPTYTLGSVLAAQLYDAVTDDVDDLEDRISKGEFGGLRDWLRENVHRHGCRYTTPVLVEVATGEEFSSDPFVEYVTGKYGRLYAL